MVAVFEGLISGHIVAAASVLEVASSVVPFAFRCGGLSLSKLPFLPTQGALLLSVLLGGELEVLEDAVHVEGVVALPPYRRAVVPGNGAIRTARVES